MRRTRHSDSPVSARASVVAAIRLRADDGPVALSHRRKRVIVRETRDLVLRVCGGGGAFLGLLYAVHHWNTRPAHCQGGGEALSRCASHTLTAGILTFLAPVFVGGIAGTLIGALIASQIRVRRAKGPVPAAPRRTGRGSSPPVRHDQAGEGRWLLA